MGTGFLRYYFKAIERSYYGRIGVGLLFLNWIVQRLFRVNSEVPYSVHFTNKVSGWEFCDFGDDTVLANLCVSTGTYIAVFEGSTLEVGSGTIWACNVCIQTADHAKGDLSKLVVASIKIGRNCWLANGVVITAGVELGDNVIVGANAVVTKSFPSNVIIAGVPAKIIGECIA